MEKRRLLMDILSNIVLFALLFNIFAFLHVVLYIYEPMSWEFLFMAIPFFALLVVRRKLRKLPIFIAIHILCLAAPFMFLGSDITFVLVLAFTLITVAYSLRARLKGELRLRGRLGFIFVLGIFATIFLIINAADIVVPGMDVLINLSTIISLAAIVLYVHMDNMEYNLVMLNRQHKKPIGGVLAANNVFIAIFLTIIVIFGIISVLFPSNGFFAIIMMMVFGILMLPIEIFFAIFRQREQPEPGSIYMEEGFHMGYLPPEVPMEMDPEELSGLIEMMERGFDAIGILALALIGLAAILVIALVIHRLHKALKKKDGGDRKENLMPDDITGKLKFMLRDIAALLPRFGLKSKHPVRRAYAKKVNSHIKQGVEVLPSHNTDVIADNIRQNEDIDGLTKEYEAVRYGKIDS